MLIVPIQFTGCLLVDSLGHVRPRLSNDVLSDYWRVHVDYHNQWFMALAQVPQQFVSKGHFDLHQAPFW